MAARTPHAQAIREFFINYMGHREIMAIWKILKTTFPAIVRCFTLGLVTTRITNKVY